MVTLALQAGEPWRAVGHAASVDWPIAIGAVCSTALFVWLLLAIARGWLGGRGYRSSSVFSEADRAILRKELSTVERKTVGRVVLVVAERSDEHAACGFQAGIVTSLVGTAFLSPWLPWDAPPALVGWLLLLGAAGHALAHVLPAFRRRFLGERRATEAAERSALEEFLSLGLTRAPGESGVLVFVTLFERRVVVVGDRGISARIDDEEWARACFSVVEATRRGSLRIGASEAVRRLGEILRRDFPAPPGEQVEPAARVEVRTSTGAA